MSLLNNMLRDLDRRGVKIDGRGEGNEPEPSVTVVKGEPASSRPWFFGVLLVSVLMALVLLAWNQWAPIHQAAQVQEPATATVTKNTALALAEPMFQNPDQNAVQSALHEANIGRLLAEAELALGRDRLTSPSEDNAYARYQEILQLFPEHPEARAGIERIARRYLALTQRQLTRKDWAGAETMLRRAQRVDPTHPELTPMVQRINVMRTAETANNAAPAAEPENIARNETVLQKVVTEPDNPTGKTHLEVTPNAAREDERRAQQARELIQQGHYPQARDLLEHWLAEYPLSPHSAAELVGIYIDQGDTSAALAGLEHADFFIAGEPTRLRAQLDLAEGQTTHAIERLEAGLPNARENERYRALLAGLYYRADRHAEAASAYRRLLDSFGSQPGYWLGLALALDAQQQDVSAVEAYRRALASGHYHGPDNRDVRDYVEQRITMLSR